MPEPPFPCLHHGDKETSGHPVLFWMWIIRENVGKGWTHPSGALSECWRNVAWVGTLPPPLTGCVILGELLGLSVPLCPPLSNW